MLGIPILLAALVGVMMLWRALRALDRWMTEGHFYPDSFLVGCLKEHWNTEDTTPR